MQTLSKPIKAEEVLDSRDIIDRCQDLIRQHLNDYNSYLLDKAADEGDDGVMELEAEDAIHDEDFMEWIKDQKDDEIQEMGVLIYLWRECEDFADWSYGEQLIRDDYFTDYARQLLEECGDIPKNIPWYIAVDWEKTADNLKVDYTYIDFMGHQYWIRNC